MLLLPTKTTDSMDTLYIGEVDDITQVNINTAESKSWNVYMNRGDIYANNKFCSFYNNYTR